MKFTSSAITLFLLTACQQTSMSIAYATTSSNSNSIRTAATAIATRTVGTSTGRRTIGTATTSTTAAASSSSSSSSSLFWTRKNGQKNRRGFVSALSLAKSDIRTNRFNNNNNNCQRTSSPFQFLSSSSSSYRGGATFSSTAGGGTSAVCPASSSSTALGQTTTTAAEAETTEVTAAPPIEIFRTDYQPLPYTVSTVDLDFQIYEGKTIVTSKLTLIDNPVAAANSNVNKNELVLNGDEESVTLISIFMDDEELINGIHYELKPGQLILKNPKHNSVITTVVEIVPENNTQLSGLYKSSSMYCTQCEAMGFRRITYYPDRPDNMAIFRKVRIEASKEQYPLLLSNGNLIEEGIVERNADRHYATWSDPYPKPSYLFATVAGNLGKIEDTYITKSGRKVQLILYSEHKNVNKLYYAMDALKRSMKWDEDRFGLEYDLDIYNVVAVEDFNMGAMENKSLNVFNTALILADEKTASDGDFERVEGVIGHEYFHNWTGNRVTCRDWFQLTLKEGLTVFRDQEFSGDMNSKAVKRIEDVRGLRGRQFSEDAGPMSHPIRPESYISMDNFYTATVYEKGAEIIRMYQTILGVEGFNKGMELYFQRHDGQAVTCDDFLAAMADANHVDLGQFSRWYSTPGTPSVKYSSKFEDGVVTLKLAQSSKSELPLHIPIAVGLLDKATGEEVVPTTVLNLKEETQTFTFEGIKGDVVPSVLRGFSAPVKIVHESGETDEESLAFIAARDTDGFNRWEAGQKLYTSLIFQTMDGKKSEKTMEYVMEAFGRTLSDMKSTDYSIKAYALILPAESALAEELDIVDPISLHKARESVKIAIARKFQKELREQYDEMTAEMEAQTEFKVDANAIGKRRLRNVLLDYLCSIRSTEEELVAAAELASNHFKKAKGMTDKMAGFSCLSSMDGKGAPYRDEATEKFYQDAEGDALVLNKWFMVQAMADLPDILVRVRKLKDSPDFTLKNPNRCRALVGAFAANAVAFHDESGKGYEFMCEILAELDKLNPQISSRLASSLIKWKRYDEKRGAKMKAQLEKLAASKLSKDLFEIVSKGLK